MSKGKVMLFGMLLCLSMHIIKAQESKKIKRLHLESLYFKKRCDDYLKNGLFWAGVCVATYCLRRQWYPFMVGAAGGGMIGCYYIQNYSRPADFYPKHLLT